VYSNEYTRAGEQWSSNEAASDRSLVWRAAGFVDEAIDEQKKFLGLQMDTSFRICYSVWSSTFSVNILRLNC